MGSEYRLRFQNADKGDVIDSLGHLQDAKLISPEELEFRATGNSSRMPDATVKAEPGGLYFCDHGGAGRDYLGRVVAKLLSAYGSVTVQEYE